MTDLLSGFPLKVTVSGLDERAQTRLAMFLQGQARGVCELVGEEQAEAAIFDLDGFGGERQWQTFRERFHGPAVVMSVGEKHLPNALWVRKPISTDDFLAAIEMIRQRIKTERHLREIEWAAERALAAANVGPPVSEPLPVRPAPEVRQTTARQSSDAAATKVSGDADGIGRAASLAWSEEQVHESCGAMEDAVYLDPKRRSELFYEPDETLQGVLRQACQRAREASCPVRLDLGGQTMMVLAGGRQVISDAREHRLRPLCAISTARRLAALQDAREDELPNMQPLDPRLHSSDRMLWIVSLWASRGRVPIGTDLDAPVSLANWPSFSRLLIPPHGMQIAALWTTHPQSLMQTAKLLAIPHRYVFALYSACLTLGLIEMVPAAKPATATRSDETPLPAEKRGLLGSVLRKLRLIR